MSDSFNGPIDREHYGFQKAECKGILKAELKPVNEFNAENVANMISVVEHELALKSLGHDEGVDITHLQYFSIANHVSGKNQISMRISVRNWTKGVLVVKMAETQP